MNNAPVASTRKKATMDFANFVQRGKFILHSKENQKLASERFFTSCVWNAQNMGLHTLSEKYPGLGVFL